MTTDTETLPEIEMRDGLPYRAIIPSKSSPTKPPYVLERSVAGRWMHIDSRCPGWTNNGACYHVSALEALNMTMEQETSTALSTNVLSQIDALDDAQVIARLTGGLPAVTKKWVYQFPGVVGLSIDGVQEAARALATQGEAIEQVWVHMDDQNENEAYFTACAVRYAVSREGQRVELDRAIRAKRQPKFTKLRAGGTQFNEFWYEVGVAKALRNAVEALLPEAIKQHMINAAGKNAPKTNGAGEMVPERGDGLRGHKEMADATAAGKELSAAARRLKAETHPDYVATIQGEIAKLVPHHVVEGKIQYEKFTADECRRATALILEALDGSPPPDDGSVSD